MRASPSGVGLNCMLASSFTAYPRSSCAAGQYGWAGLGWWTFSKWHGPQSLQACHATRATYAIQSRATHLLLDVVRHCGIRADAILLHLGNQVALRQAWRRLRRALQPQQVEC